MAPPIFSKSEALRFGRQTTKQNFWFFVSILFVVVLVNFIPQLIEKSSLERPVKAIINLAVFISALILELGLIKICLKFYDQQKPEFDDLFSQYHLFFRMFFGSILYGLVVTFGLILFLIPGIIFAVRLNFYEYIIVDKGAGAIAALKQSFQITKGATGNLILFYLLVIGINVIGFLFFVVGLLLTIPTTMLATAFVYRKLLTKTT